MHETHLPSTRSQICDDLKVIHRGPESVIEAVFDLTVDLLETLMADLWCHVRRLRLPRARRAMLQIIEINALAKALGEEDDPARAHLMAWVLVLSLPEWVYQSTASVTRAEVLAVADYTGWAIEPEVA